MKKTIFVLAIAFVATLPEITFAQAGAEYISISGNLNEKSIPVLETIHADGKVERKELEAGKGMLGMVKSLESIRIELVLQLNVLAQDGFEIVATLSDYQFILRRKN